MRVFPIPRVSQGCPGILSSPQGQQTLPPSRTSQGTQPSQTPTILGGGPACDEARDDSQPRRTGVQEVGSALN